MKGLPAVSVLIFGAFFGGCADNSSEEASTIAANAADSIARQFVGAWRQVQVTYQDSITGAMVTEEANPGFYLFTPRYFSMQRFIMVPLPPRVDVAMAEADDLRAWWNSMLSIVGTYEIRGDTLISQNELNRMGPSADPDAWFSDVFRISGDSLWLSPAAATSGPRTPFIQSIEILYLRER
jgi:hypothetical protein